MGSFKQLLNSGVFSDSDSMERWDSSYVWFAVYVLMCLCECGLLLVGISRRNWIGAMATNINSQIWIKVGTFTIWSRGFFQPLSNGKPVLTDWTDVSTEELRIEFCEQAINTSDGLSIAESNWPPNITSQKTLVECCFYFKKLSECGTVTLVLAAIVGVTVLISVYELFRIVNYRCEVYCIQNDRSSNSYCRPLLDDSNPGAFVNIIVNSNKERILAWYRVVSLRLLSISSLLFVLAMWLYLSVQSNRQIDVFISFIYRSESMPRIRHMHLSDSWWCVLGTVFLSLLSSYILAVVDVSLMLYRDSTHAVNSVICNV
eukprot:Platyproteum_vivax@DN1359_c0_g1_i1.p1